MKKKLTVKNVIYCISLLIITLSLNSCNKEKSSAEEFARIEQTYGVKFNKNVLKMAPTVKLEEFNTISEIENKIKYETLVASSSRILPLKKNDVNEHKIMGYIYSGGEFGGGGDPTQLYHGEFSYANPLGVTIYTIEPGYVFNTVTKEFTNLNVAIFGITGQYSCTLTNTTYSNLGLYHRVYHYYVSITRTVIYQGSNASYTYSKHYTLTVNKTNGLLVGVNEIY